MNQIVYKLGSLFLVAGSCWEEILIAVKYN